MKLHGRGQKQHHKVLSSDPQHPQGYRLVSLLSGPTPLKATNRSRRLNVQWRSLRCIPLEKASQLTSQAQGQRTVARQHSRYWPTRRQDDYKEGDSCKEVNELWFQLHKSTCTVGLARWLRGSRHLPHKSDNLRQRLWNPSKVEGERHLHRMTLWLPHIHHGMYIPSPTTCTRHIQ